MPLLNLKNSRFFTFSALNASFLSTQGNVKRRTRIFGSVFLAFGRCMMKKNQNSRRNFSAFVAAASGESHSWESAAVSAGKL